MSTRLRQRDTIASTIAGAKMIDKLLEWAWVGGRANRKPYWLTALATFGVVMVCAFVMAPFLPGEGQSVGTAAIIAICIPVLPVLYMIWVCIAVSIRRLHDRDKSGWWAVLYLAVPVILDAIAGDNFDTMGPLILLKVASGLISLFALIDLGFLKGTTGPNRYGPDPLAAPQTMADASDVPVT